MTTRRGILGWLLGLVFGVPAAAQSAPILLTTGVGGGPDKERKRKLVREWLKMVDDQLQVAIEDGRSFQFNWEAGEVVGLNTHVGRKWECGMLDGRHDFKIHIDRKSDEVLLKAWNGPGIVPRDPDAITGINKVSMSMTSDTRYSNLTV